MYYGDAGDVDDLKEIIREGIYAFVLEKRATLEVINHKAVVEERFQ